MFVFTEVTRKKPPEPETMTMNEKNSDYNPEGYEKILNWKARRKALLFGSSVFSII